MRANALAKQSAIVRDLLLAHVLEREGELVAHLVAHHAADADPTRLGQGFEPGRDVDAVTEDVVPIDDRDVRRRRQILDPGYECRAEPVS